MTIILHLALAIGFLYLAGYGATGLLVDKIPINWRWFALVTGYTLSQIIFFFAYVLFGDAWTAFLAVLAAVVFLAGMVYLKNRKVFSSDQWKVGACFHGETGRLFLYSFILLCAGWPYLLSGWGSYWHSGNEDIMDALRGRDSYLLNSLATADLDVGSRVRDVESDRFLVKTGVLKEARTAEWFANRYATETIRFQYSSVAFWSILLDMPHKMDAFLVQALLNLTLMGQGVYLVARFTLAMSPPMAVLAGCFAVLNNFYLTTYFNGHQGSLMYNAVAPFLLFMGLVLIKSERWTWSLVSLPVIWLVFIANTYPYPLPYLLLPLAAYWLYLKLILPRWSKSGANFKKISLAVSLFVGIAAGYLLAWHLFEPVRLRAADQFRSWQTMFNYVGFFQYWGIWPSNLANSSTILGYLFQRVGLVGGSAVLAIGLTGLALAGFRSAWHNHYRFFGFWLASWLLFFPFMRYIAADPYYLYKFLYLNGYIIWLMVIFGVWTANEEKNRAKRIIFLGLLGVTGVLNLANNGIAGWAIREKPYNRSAQAYERIATIPADMLAASFIDIPWYDHGDVVRQIVTAAGLQTQADKTLAKYLLRLNGADDVTFFEEEEIVWRSELFRLVKAPAVNMVHLVSYWEPERTRSELRPLPFRWVSDGKINAFTVKIARPDTGANYLHFCAEPGPSVDFRPLTIVGQDSDGGLLGSYLVDVVDGYSCHWIPIKGKKGPFTFFSNERGKMISPIEPRKLNYRISMVGLSNTEYDEKTVAAIALRDDIVKADGVAAAVPRVRLGNKWHEFESFVGENFRWVGNDAEIVMYGSPGESVRIEMLVEPGPSMGNVPLSLMLVDRNERAIGSATISERQHITWNLPPLEESFQVVRLHVLHSDNLIVPNDHRVLNFRVFTIKPFLN